MTIEGYYNGKQYVALEDVAVKENQKVRITILDEYLEQDAHGRNVEMLARYKGFGGSLWKEDAQEYVSALRAEERSNPRKISGYKNCGFIAACGCTCIRL